MNVFDILGPVMIGPSSSHTAGAARLGRIARELLGCEPVKAEIRLHGSFARTYRGHGTDRALAAGIQGMDTDDPGLRDALETAKKRGLDITFKTVELDDAHPNTAWIILTGGDGRQVSMIGSSIGGGNILVTKLNGMDVYVTGEKETLIVRHKDVPGIIAQVTEVAALAEANICNFRLSRQEKGGEAVMTIELDGIYGEELGLAIGHLPNIYSSIVLKPVS
ncbi:MAG: L-serine ammonia-lyase, iron-sulfur-dependent subunit beta [Eubacteriales bacterium]|nr:L-serine ammonia-lyase, iron-sulfur-dependent subunit beta [Eubacteriales bacterium]